jgi:glycerate kinase
MNIVIAPAPFKGSLSSVAAADAIEQGVRAVMPEAETVRLPLADGGEGTVEALVSATRGRLVQAKVLGPLREPVEAMFGVLGDDVTGVIEMAAAAGLDLIPPDKRNPLITTTFGVGQLIRAALEAGCRRLIIGIGGSATNDGGAGMAQALGARLTDAQAREIGPGGQALRDLAKIDISNLDPRIALTEVFVACDVNNPLVGPQGAAAVYGPQKGATAEMVAILDDALSHYADVIVRDLGREVRDLPGAGAAGGLGAGLIAFLDARPRMGIALVMEALNFEQYIEAADVLITGEGRIDEQTFFGKVIQGVCRLAKRHGVPVIVLAGEVAHDSERLLEEGIEAAFSIAPGPISLDKAMQDAGPLLQEAAERVTRLLLVARDLGRKA